jgi:hypothetical protein
MHATVPFYTFGATPVFTVIFLLLSLLDLWPVLYRFAKYDLFYDCWFVRAVLKPLSSSIMISPKINRIIRGMIYRSPCIAFIYVVYSSIINSVCGMV